MAQDFASLSGQLLLDGGALTGSFFHRSVVLVCQHDADGAFGLVLNRAAGGCLGDFVEPKLPEVLHEKPVFLGGPVQPSAFSYLRTEETLATAAVMGGIDLGHSLERLVELTAEPASSHRVRVFAGYSGWSPGQLESELKRNAWLTHPATVGLVFDTNPDELWRMVLRQKGWEQRLLADTPDDAKWN
jgi:putative transcriptional regulator